MKPYQCKMSPAQFAEATRRIVAGIHAREPVKAIAASIGYSDNHTSMLIKHKLGYLPCFLSASEREVLRRHRSEKSAARAP